MADAWRRVLEHHPAHAVAWRGLLEALWRSHDLDGLRQIADSDLERCPAHLKLIARARLLESNGKASDSATELETAFGEHGVTDLLEELCRITVDNGMSAEALRWLNVLVQRRPEDASVYRNLGLVHLRRQHYVEAERCARHALHLRPAYSSAQQLLDELGRIGGRADDRSSAFTARDDIAAATSLVEDHV
jgi:uncharacterized protein HemY